MNEDQKFFDQKIYLHQEIKNNFYRIPAQPFRLTKRKLPKKQKNELKNIQTNFTHDNMLLDSILARVIKIQQRQSSISEKQKLQNQLVSILPVVQTKINAYNIRKSQNQLLYKKQSNHEDKKVVTQQKITRTPSNSLVIEKKMLSLQNNKSPQRIKPSQRYSFLPQFKKPYKQIQQNALRASYTVINQKKSAQNINSAVLNSARKSQYVNSNKKSIINCLQKIDSENYLDFTFIINWSNNIIHKSDTSSQYKVFIGKGNNHSLIKSIFKKKFWWHIQQQFNESQINFYWSQNKNIKFLNTLPNFDETNIQSQQKQNKVSNKFKLNCLMNNDIKKLVSSADLKFFEKKFVKQKPEMIYYKNPNQIKAHNHLQYNWHLCNKKMLYKNLKQYYLKIKKDPFKYIPITFHVKQQGDQQWNDFIKYFEIKNQQIQENKKNFKQNNLKIQQKNVWIIKPGENTNRGQGIEVSDSIEQIRGILNKNRKNNEQKRTYIIQIYILPFLFHKRKFDIRSYMLLTSVNKMFKGYWYEDGYIRTSSKQFNYKNLSNKMVHLTNDAIQKFGEDYGKFEPGNKISFTDFQKYLNHTYNSKYNLKQMIQPHMISLAKDAIKATYLSLDLHKKQYTFQVLGLDFLIDQNFKVWLIQINTNPCLQLSCPLLSQIIPQMIQNSLRIGLDSIFPPPKQWARPKVIANNLFESNKYTLIFDNKQQQRIKIRQINKHKCPAFTECDESQMQN